MGGKLFPTRWDYASAAPMLDITIINPCEPGPLGKAVEKREHEVDVAVSRKSDKYEGTLPNKYKLPPLDVSTYEYYPPDFQTSRRSWADYKQVR